MMPPYSNNNNNGDETLGIIADVLGELCRHYESRISSLSSNIAALEEELMSLRHRTPVHALREARATAAEPIGPDCYMALSPSILGHRLFVKAWPETDGGRQDGLRPS